MHKDHALLISVCSNMFFHFYNDRKDSVVSDMKVEFNFTTFQFCFLKLNLQLSSTFTLNTLKKRRK